MKLVSMKYDDDDCMYKYRTKKCWDRNCKKGKGCFDSHCNTIRRVPQWLPYDNLFNYIPQECPEYKKQKKCAMGNACYLAHGWLEIIYHPLVFKTKLCESRLKKGVCSKYGIHCAKAHNDGEVRNLVSIYGKDWRRHYQARRESVKTTNREAKHKLSKSGYESDSSNYSGSTGEDQFFKLQGMSDVSYQMYGGSPLFVSTPPISPSISTGTCSDSGDCLLMNHMASIDLSSLQSSLDDGEVGMYTKLCNKGASNKNKTQDTLSLFHDRFLWAFDLSSKEKDTITKEAISSCSGSDILSAMLLKSQVRGLMVCRALLTKILNS